MPMYALGVLPLILIYKLDNHAVSQFGMQMIPVPVVLCRISVNSGMIYCHLVLITDTLLMLPSVGCF